MVAREVDEEHCRCPLSMSYCCRLPCQGEVLDNRLAVVEVEDHSCCTAVVEDCCSHMELPEEEECSSSEEEAVHCCSPGQGMHHRHILAKDKVEDCMLEEEVRSRVVGRRIRPVQDRRTSMFVVITAACGNDELLM